MRKEIVDGVLLTQATERSLWIVANTNTGMRFGYPTRHQAEKKAKEIASLT